MREHGTQEPLEQKKTGVNEENLSEASCEDGMELSDEEMSGVSGGYYPQMYSYKKDEAKERVYND